MGCLHSLEVPSYEILINYKGKMNNLHWWVFLVSPGNITTNGTDRNYVPLVSAVRRAQQHCCDIPAKDHNLNLIVRMYQKISNWGPFLKLACNLQKMPRSWKSGNYSQAVADWRRLNIDDNSMQPEILHWLLLLEKTLGQVAECSWGLRMR